MNRFIENLPNYYADLQKLQRESSGKLRSLEAKLDADSEEPHECDCKYCDEQSPPPLTRQERIQLEEEIEELTPIVEDQDKTIGAVERYATFMKVPLYNAVNKKVKS